MLKDSPHGGVAQNVLGGRNDVALLLVASISLQRMPAHRNANSKGGNEAYDALCIRCDNRVDLRKFGRMSSTGHQPEDLIGLASNERSALDLYGYWMVPAVIMDRDAAETVRRLLKWRLQYIEESRKTAPKPLLPEPRRERASLVAQLLWGRLAKWIIRRTLT